jgi:hypothetical protein
MPNQRRLDLPRLDAEAPHLACASARPGTPAPRRRASAQVPGAVHNARSRRNRKPRSRRIRIQDLLPRNPERVGEDRAQALVTPSQVANRRLQRNPDQLDLPLDRRAIDPVSQDGVSQKAAQAKAG